MKKRMLALFATLGFVAVGSLALASPASATEDEVTFPICSTWQMRGAVGTYPNIEFTGAPAGSSFDDTEATLVKALDNNAEDAGLPGVEFASKNITFKAKQSTVVKVSFDLDSKATDDDGTSAGALRLFGYSQKNADTLNAGPTYGGSGDAVATTDEGDLSFTIPAGGWLGTLGVTYDGSNSAKGSVKFTRMMIGDREVRFKPCPPTGPNHETDGPECDNKDMKVTITNPNQTWPVAIYVWVKGDPEPMRVAAGAKVEGTVTEATRYGWAFEASKKAPRLSEAQLNGSQRRVGDWTFVDIAYKMPDCSTPPPVAGGGGGDEDKPVLPVTGANAAIIGSIGAAILVIGAAAVVAARKRRIRTVA